MVLYEIENVNRNCREREREAMTPNAIIDNSKSVILKTYRARCTVLYISTIGQYEVTVQLTYF